MGRGGPEKSGGRGSASQRQRVVLQAMLARVTAARARAMPMVRMAARLLVSEDVLDAGAHRRAAAVGPAGRARHRPAPGLLSVDAADHSVLGEPGLVLGRAVRAVGPDIARGAGPLDQPLAQPRSVVAGGIGDDLAAHDAVHPVDRDVRLVAERGTARAIGSTRSVRALGLERCSVQRASTSLGRALAGFWGQISAALRPSLACAFSSSVRRRRGAATRVASTICPPRGRWPAAVIARSSSANSSSSAPARISASRKSRSVLASGTASPGPSWSEPHPGEAIAHEVLGRLERQPVQRLQHQHPELQHRVEARAPTLPARWRPKRRGEGWADHLEVHPRRQRLKPPWAEISARRSSIDQNPSCPAIGPPLPPRRRVNHSSPGQARFPEVSR